MRSRSLRVQAAIAIVLGTVLACVPNAVAGRLGIIEVIAILIWVSVDGWLLAVAMRTGARRGLSIAWTLALGYTAVVAFGAVWLQLVVASGLVQEKLSGGRTVIAVLADGAYSSLLVLGVWSLVYVMPRVVREERERERERHELLREAEHARVRAALEPHFVLNTLTAIGALVGDEPDTARELIGDLGDLLRDVVRVADRDRQSAADEVAWLQRYARVMEARHRGRLTVELHLDPAAANVEIPVLVLQPLVENAIQHGALQRVGGSGGHVRVDLAIVAGGLRCTIEDNGPGMAAQPRDGAHGLSLTRRRLATTAPGSSLVIESTPTGTRVVVTTLVATIVERARGTDTAGALPMTVAARETP